MEIDPTRRSKPITTNPVDESDAHLFSNAGRPAKLFRTGTQPNFNNASIPALQNCGLM
jgi:hypothetical protein